MAESIVLLFIALVSIIILLRILVVVHHQNNKMKELEMRLKAMDNMEVETPTDTND